MKVSRTLMKKIFPMFLSLVLIIGLVGVNVKATVVDEPENEVQEEIIDTDEGIQADEAVDEEPIIEDDSEEASQEEIYEEDPTVIVDDADETAVEDEEPVIDAAADETAEYTEIKVTKSWVDVPDELKEKLPEITLHLYQDDVEIDKITMNSRNATADNPLVWEASFYPDTTIKFPVGKKYTLKEDSLTDFDSSISEFKESEAGDKTGSFTVTNTYKTPAEEAYEYITINKTWDLTEGGETTDLTFNLEVRETAEAEEAAFTVPVEMKKQDGNKWTLDVKAPDGKKFIKTYDYNLVEMMPEGFEVSSLTFDDGVFNITNTYNPDVPPTEYDKIYVKKIWDLTKGGSTSDITFTLYQDGKEYDKVTLKAKDYVTEGAEEEEETDEAEARVYEWETSFSPKSGDTFTAEHEYTLLESGASADFDVSGLTDFDDTKGSFTVTNTYNPGSDDTFSIFVRKYWSGGTAEVMNLNIYQDVKPGEGQPYLTYELYAETCAEEDGSWYFQIDNLPRGHEYYMSESATGYTGSTPVIITENGLKGWKVTNTYTGGGTGTNDTTTVDTTSAKTGDNNNLIIYIVILLVAAVAVVGALIYKKKNK